MARSVPRPRHLVGVVACALLVGVWYLTLAPTRIGGPMTPVLVRGTSMLPTYETGDLVLAFRSSDLRAGQVAVFRAPPGGYVIHRITAIEGDRVVTRGDNRVRPDPWPTTTGDVLGVARLSVPGVGRYVLTLADPLLLAAAAGAIAATVVMWPTRRRDHRVPRAAGPVATVLVLTLLPVLGSAAGMTVTTDQLATMQLTGPFPTYVITPGGGGGGGGGGSGCNGQGNKPGC